MDIQDSTTMLKEIIRGAKRGSISQLKKLSSLMRSHYTLEMLDVFLTHINVSKPPSSLTRSQIDAGTYSTMALVEVQQWCAANPPLANDTVNRLISSLDGIVFWICHLLGVVPGEWSGNPLRLEQNGLLRPYEVTALVFRGLAYFSPHLWQCATEKKTVLELCILWWTATNDNNPPLYPLGDRYGGGSGGIDDLGDSAMDIFYMAAKTNPYGLANAIVEGRVCRPKVCIQRTILRMQALVQINQIKNLSHLPDNTIETRNLLFTVHAMEELMRMNQRLATWFVEKDGLGSFMAVLTMIALKVSIAPDFLSTPLSQRTQHMSNLLYLSSCIIDWAESTTSAVIENLKSTLFSGVTQILAECIPIVNPPLPNISIPGKMTSRTFEAVVATLEYHSMWPKLLPYVFRDVGRYIPAKLNNGGRSTPAGKVADSFSNMLSNFNQYLEYGRKRWFRTCDNLDHHHQRRRLNRQKTCSTCHSVVYCSLECQTEDWKARHKRECKHMYLNYLEQKHSNTWYSHHIRAFHTTILIDTYESVSHLWAANAIEKLPTDSNMEEGEVLVTTDVIHSNRTVPISISEYLKRNKDVVPPYLKPRFISLVSRFTSSKPANKLGLGVRDLESDVGNLRLVEGVFHLGPQDFNLLVLLRKIRNTVIPGNTRDARIKAARELAGYLNVVKKSDYQVENSLMFISPHREYE